MWAMMLDTKRTFDRIVERYAPDPATRERIYNNKIYKHLSQMLAGSQEYMAMERLYEIWQQDAYDVIVVDTPPMQNAVDFLDAPDRLSNMISNSMLHLLLKPSITLGKAGFKFLEKGSQQILKIFDRIVGFAFLQDISEMLIAFQELLGGFNSRAVEVKALLQSPATHFMAVCTTNANSVSETEGFSKKLGELGYHLKKIVVNRICPGKALSKDRLASDHKVLLKIFLGSHTKPSNTPLGVRIDSQDDLMVNVPGRLQKSSITA
jgi:anion-transporting  ArsA/GET3 family ATPase